VELNGDQSDPKDYKGIMPHHVKDIFDRCNYELEVTSDLDGGWLNDIHALLESAQGLMIRYRKCRVHNENAPCEEIVLEHCNACGKPKLLNKSGYCVDCGGDA